MRAVLKWLGYLLGSLVLLVVVAAVFLTLWFDPSDYKDEIIAAVERRTGRTLTIAGELDLSVYPWLGIEAQDLALANAPGFGPEPFARVRELGVAVKLLPLLERRVEVRTIVLRGLVLNLVRDASGRSNWEDLAPAQAAGDEPSAPVAPAAEPGVALAALVVSGVQIEDATVSWDDRATGERYTLGDLKLQTGVVNLPEPFPVQLDTKLTSARPALGGHLTLATEAHLDPGGSRYRLAGTRARLALQGEGVPQGLEAVLQSDIRADLAEDALHLDGLKLATLGLEMSGAVTATGITGTPRFHGTLDLSPFDPRALLQRLGQPPPQTASPEALSRASASFGFVARPDGVDVSELVVLLDQSGLTGTLQVRNPAAPAIGFNLALDGIDLDAYLPPRAERSAAPPLPAEAAAGATAHLPLDTLRALNLDGSLGVGALKVSNLRMQDVQVRAKADGGLIQVEPITAGLYQGRYAGSARLDARGNALQSQTRWTLSGVQAGPLLKDLTGEERLLGTGNVEADLSAAGSDPAAIRRTLGGNARLSFINGAVKGINIAHLIRTAQATLEGRPPPPSEANQTDFSELAASLRIENGVARNEDLHGKSPLLRVTGAGSADLAQETVDYTLNAVLVATLEGQGGRALEELKGVSIPIRITGALAEPRVAVDVERLVAERVKAEAERKAGKLQERLGKELERKLGDQVDPETRDRLLEQVPGALRGLFR